MHYKALVRFGIFVYVLSALPFTVHPKYVIVKKPGGTNSLIKLEEVPKGIKSARSEELCPNGEPKCSSRKDCNGKGKYNRCGLGLGLPPKDGNNCRHCFLGPIGRPFKVNDDVRTANSQTCKIENNCASLEWTIEETPTVSGNDSVIQEIGRRWLEQAEGEHASVASFARFTLQLMAIGATPQLLTNSQNAAIDEIRHAKISYGFANKFLKTHFEPGPINIDDSLPKLDLKGIVHSIIEEGCIEETIAAAEARFGAYVAKDPATKLVMTEISDDETRHAQLAWDTIRWIIKKFPELHSFVLEIFEVELESRFAHVSKIFEGSITELCMPNNINTILHDHGILANEDRAAIRRAVIKTIIQPIYLDGLQNVGLISNKLIQMNYALV